MLKRLMKYDLKRTLKYLVWFYALSIVLSGICRLLDIWKDIHVIRILSSVFSSLTYSAIATVLVNTFFHILLSFVASFYKDQSYLTHTLPVKKDNLLLSKYLSALIVVLCSVLACVFSLFIMLYSSAFIKTLKTAILSAVIGLNIGGGTLILLLVLIIFSQILALISMAFSAIVKGHSYNQKRRLKGVLWFVVYYLASMYLTLIFAVICTTITGEIKTLFSNQMSSSAFLTVLIVALISYWFYALFFYFLCKREFNKGVNVD